VDGCEGFINLGDQFGLAVWRAKLNCSIRLRRSTVSKIRMILVFFLKVLQCYLGFLENILPPSKQLRAKIFALALVHKRFLVGWSIIFGFCQHCHLIPVFVFARSRSPPAAGLYTSVNQRTISEQGARRGLTSSPQNTTHFAPSGTWRTNFDQSYDNRMPLRISSHIKCLKIRDGPFERPV